MPSKRSLPKRRNPLLEPEHTPSLEILVERRRLGQTKLDVNPSLVNKINATSPSNLGNFDYAHLRVPLPKDLEGSGIFFAQNNSMFPESYFLMRRSSDGYLSATGMFKAAFPWASKDEEIKERTFHKKLTSSGPDEVAGNVWISPEEALELAEEYSMRPWIEALLDSRAIEKGTKDSNATIATPPRFKLPERDEMFPVPQLSASTMRKRELRSASPGKTSTPAGRKIASPRKRKTKAAKGDETPAKAASSALRGALENGTGASSVEPTPSVASESTKDDTIRVEVTETQELVNGVETTHTNVKVAMPADNPDLELPSTAEGVIEKAHEIAETARKLQEAKGKGLKRKADDLEEAGEDGEKKAETVAVQPVKKQRVLEDQLKKERVKARALIGITATLAIGAMVPYFF